MSFSISTLSKKVTPQFSKFANEKARSSILWGVYTFSIEMLTGSEINEDFHDGVGISLGTPVGGLKLL